MKQGSVIAHTVFSIVQTAFLSQATIDVAKGVDITYRTDVGLFKLSLPRAKSKLKEIVDLQYADNCAVFARSRLSQDQNVTAFWLKKN